MAFNYRVSDGKYMEIESISKRNFFLAKYSIMPEYFSGKIFNNSVM